MRDRRGFNPQRTARPMPLAIALPNAIGSIIACAKRGLSAPQLEEILVTKSATNGTAPLSTA
jgi:hypothetical protein